jgi:hypothetical protein
VDNRSYRSNPIGKQLALRGPFDTAHLHLFGSPCTGIYRIICTVSTCRIRRSNLFQNHILLPNTYISSKWLLVVRLLLNHTECIADDSYFYTQTYNFFFTYTYESMQMTDRWWSRRHKIPSDSRSPSRRCPQLRR